MKLSRLMALVLALCGAGFAQTNVQCDSFPCPVSITAAQCPSSFPCALTISLRPSVKFKLGDKVIVTHAGPTLAVRLTPSATGALLGMQPNGRSGIVVGGPVLDAAGDNKIRWQIDYAIGVDGWSVQDYLEKAKIQPPPAPLVTLTPPTLTFPSQPLGSTTTQSVALVNSGFADLIISVPFVDAGDFHSSGSCVTGTHYAPGTGCGLNIAFTPTALGVRLGSVTLVDNAGTQLLTLGGTAVAAVAKNVVLSWLAPASDGAASYNLYRAPGSGTSGTYVKVGSVAGSLLTFTDSAVPSGSYSYVATTVDASGNESADSTAATVVIP